MFQEGKWFSKLECFVQEKLISCSIDQTIKIWSLENAQGFKNAEKTLYDHEEEIIAAVVCPHPDVHLLATADVDGQIIVRDLAEPDAPMCHIRPDLEYEPPECVSILFNQQSSLRPEVKTCDLFVAVNNQLFYYSLEGDEVKQFSFFQANIVSMAQDNEVLLLALENNRLISFDWREGEALNENNELTDNDTMTGELKIEERSAAVIIAGEKNGDI